MITETETPRAWVGCLGCYNAGALVGAWVDAVGAEDLDPHSILATDTDLLSGLPNEPPCGRPEADERWCLDVEGELFEGECSPSEAAYIGRQTEAIIDAGYPVGAVKAWADNIGRAYAFPTFPLPGEPEDILDAFSEAYCGEYASGADYAEELAEELGVIDRDATHGWPFDCIDWERAWRELEYGGDNYAVDSPGGVYVFRA